MNRKNQNNPPAKNPLPPEPNIPQLYQVVVECSDETDQRRVYERLTTENRKCRLIIL